MKLNQRHFTFDHKPEALNGFQVVNIQAN
jgi:hypothetical protein